MVRRQSADVTGCVGEQVAGESVLLLQSADDTGCVGEQVAEAPVLLLQSADDTGCVGEHGADVSVLRQADFRRDNGTAVESVPDGSPDDKMGQ